MGKKRKIRDLKMILTFWQEGYIGKNIEIVELREEVARLTNDLSLLRAAVRESPFAADYQLEKARLKGEIESLKPAANGPLDGDE